MYEILFSDLAEKQLAKLDQPIKDRIGRTIQRIKIRPLHFVERLSGNPYYKFRVGDYRIILDIQQDKLIIFVIELGHRKNIYAKL